VENLDLLVFVDNVLVVESSVYTVENLSDEGGDIEFVIAPSSGANVLIIRKTSITQQVDYQDFQPFPAETHEWNLDKLTYILQELLNGALSGIDSDGNPFTLTFNLSVTQQETTLTIVNSGGTDAALPMWESGTKAGVFAGELVPEASVPDDGTVTTKPDGYIWLGY
jgi:hypothetical protein